MCSVSYVHYLRGGIIIKKWKLLDIFQNRGGGKKQTKMSNIQILIMMPPGQAGVGLLCRVWYFRFGNKLGYSDIRKG